MSRINPQTRPRSTPPTNNRTTSPAQQNSENKGKTNRIALPVLTELFVLADSKGNTDYRVSLEEWNNLFGNPNDSLQIYKNGGQNSILSDKRFEGASNASKRTRIINNFKQADGFNQIQIVLNTLSEDSNMRQSLFDYGMQIQKERHNDGGWGGLIPNLGQGEFDTHNVPDGIALSAFSQFGDKVDGVSYNPQNGRWGGSTGRK